MVNKTTVGRLLFIVGLILSSLFFLLLPRSPLKAGLERLIGESAASAFTNALGILAPVFIVPGFIILESHGKPREEVVRLKGYIFIGLLSLIIGAYISYRYFNVAKTIYSACLIFVSSYTVFYLIWLRKYRRGETRLERGSLRVYLYKGGEVTEVTKEELPSELRERLESIANKVLEEVKPRFQWYEILLLAVFLFFTISALVVLIIS
jgi:hypothetical protein